MQDFYVGQKVVCVDAAYLGSDTGLLVEGRVYTIRYIDGMKGCVHPSRQHLLAGVSLYLHEAVRCPDDLGFSSKRFRPLVETDISVFEAMLAPEPIKQRETEDA